MLAPFVDLSALVLLVAANSAPVIVARFLGSRFAAPLDAHRAFRDGRPLFGPHKIWRGVLAGTLASGVAGAVLAPGFAAGAAFGALALAGDLCSSFFKRRLGRASGAGMPLVDQLPEALLPMVMLQAVLHLTPLSIVGTALVFTLLDLVATKVASRAHAER